MTYKEKLMIEHPDNLKPRYVGGCYGCPSDYGYFPDDEKPCHIDSRFKNMRLSEKCTLCWNREIPTVEKSKLHGFVDFAMDKIHSGYVIELRNGALGMCIRAGAKFTKIFVFDDPKKCPGVDKWCYASTWGNNPKYVCPSAIIGVMSSTKEYDIVAVYGLVEGTAIYGDCCKISKAGRKLVWSEEKPPVKMTMEQVCKALGYSVEIVAEERKKKDD